LALMLGLYRWGIRDFAGCTAKNMIKKSGKIEI